MADETKKYLVNIESNLKKYADEATEAKKKVDELAASNKALKDSGTATQSEIEASTAALKNANAEYSKAQKMVQLQTAANSSESGSRKQLSEILKLQQQELGKLGSAYTKDAQGIMRLNPLYTEQRNKIAATQKAIIDYDQSLNDGRSNVGRYGEAVKAAMSTFQSIPGPIGRAITTITGFRTTVQTMAEGVTKAMAGFGKSMKQSEVITSDFSQAVGNETARAALEIKGFAKTTESATNAATVATKGFGASLKALLLNPFVLAIAAVITVVGGLISIFKKFTPVVEAVERVMAGIKAVFTGVANAVIGLVTGQKTLKESFSGLGESIKTAYNEGVKWKQLQQDLFEMTTENAVADAKRKTQMDELLLASRNRSKSEEERMQLIDQALLLEEVQFAERKKIADAQVSLAEQSITKGRAFTAEELRLLREKGIAYANELKMKKNITEEEIKGYSDSLVAQEQVSTESIALREKAQNRADALDVARQKKIEKALKDKEDAEKKMRDAQEKLDKEIEDYKKFISDQQKIDAEALVKKKQDELDHDEWVRNRDLANEENLIAIKEANNQWLYSTERQRLEIQRQDEVANAEKTGADINLINAKYAALNRQIDIAEADAKLMLYSDFAGNLATIFGEQTAIGKAAAIAQTTISTYVAAQKAYASVIEVPVIGPVLAVVAAAAAVAAGIANVKKILEVKVPGGNDKGGSLPTAISSSAPAQKFYANPVGSSVLTQAQLSQQQLNAMPNQNLLTADDIAAAISNLKIVTTIEDINVKQKSTNKIVSRANI
jgi:hypothetical protein